MSSILFAKHVSFEHSVSSPRSVITSRREEKNNKAKVFQHPIDSHSQSASSCLISPHFVAGAVGVGRGAASFLATESTGTVLIPRLMTRIAGHAHFHFPCLSLSHSRIKKTVSQTCTCCSQSVWGHRSVRMCPCVRRCMPSLPSSLKQKRSNLVNSH